MNLAGQIKSKLYLFDALLK